MDRYEIKLNRILKTGIDGKSKTEIWAKIRRLDSSHVEKKLIFWEDEEGQFHDETPNLPVEYRDLVDNAWIEKKRYW